jgi:transcriptional regulator with XRE-family HTH domain
MIAMPSKRAKLRGRRATRPTATAAPHATRPSIYSIRCYSWHVSGRGELLREVMRETRTTQSALSRLSGVRQPSISQFLSGTVDLSDDQLDRLLSCMGYRLEVSRRPVVPDLTRSERRSWRLHCRLSIRLTPASLEEWRPVIERNLKRLRSGVTGQPHSRNLDRWESLVGHGDELALHRVLTGLDRDSIEMREVSPMGGLLPQDERQAALQEAG